MKPLFPQMLSDDKALFEAADKNRDGHLDRKEILSFTHPEEDPTMLPIIFEQTLQEKDSNEDGFIDFKEYIGERGNMFGFAKIAKYKNVNRASHFSFKLLKRKI